MKNLKISNKKLVTKVVVSLSEVSNGELREISFDDFKEEILQKLIEKSLYFSELENKIILPETLKIIYGGINSKSIDATIDMEYNNKEK